jgi:hypothetical protein
MSIAKGSVPINIPADVWQPLVEVKAQLDALYPRPPTPIEEALRVIINHYRHCLLSENETLAFCERAKAWKETRGVKYGKR